MKTEMNTWINLNIISVQCVRNDDKSEHYFTVTLIMQTELIKQLTLRIVYYLFYQKEYYNLSVPIIRNPTNHGYIVIILSPTRIFYY